MSEDQKVSQNYRALGQEEPPRHVDEAILAASRRAASARPAPLVAPTGRRRWYFPVAAAAVVVLAAGVALHVERDQADIEMASVLMKRQVEEAPKEKKLTDGPAQQELEMRPPMPGSSAEARAGKKAIESKAAVDAPAQRNQEMRPPAAVAQAPVQAPARAESPKTFAYAPDPPRAAAAAPSVTQEQQAQDRVVVEALRKDEAASHSRAREPAPAATAKPKPDSPRELGAASGRVGERTLADQPPEKWLERITELRKAGRHEEADKLLEEFRKRFPEQKVPESALRK